MSSSTWRNTNDKVQVTHRELSWMVTMFWQIIQKLSIANYEKKSHNDCSLTEKYTGKFHTSKSMLFLQYLEQSVPSQQAAYHMDKDSDCRVAINCQNCECSCRYPFKIMVLNCGGIFWIICWTSKAWAKEQVTNCYLLQVTWRVLKLFRREENKPFSSRGKKKYLEI